MLCLVTALVQYFEEVRPMGIDVAHGYLFWPVSKEGLVFLEPLSYSTVYDRLKHYLDVLGIDGGETPHIMWPGCAVTLGIAGGPGPCGDIMHHGGWSSAGTMNYYTWLPQIMDGTVTAKVLWGLQIGLVLLRLRLFSLVLQITCFCLMHSPGKYFTFRHICLVVIFYLGYYYLYHPVYDTFVLHCSQCMWSLWWYSVIEYYVVSNVALQ